MRRNETVDAGELDPARREDRPSIQDGGKNARIDFGTNP